MTGPLLKIRNSRFFWATTIPNFRRTRVFYIYAALQYVLYNSTTTLYVWRKSASNCTVTTQQAVFTVADHWFAQTDGTGCYDVPLYNKPFKWIILIMCLLSLTKEIFQVVYDKWEYFLDFSNYVEWSLYICTVLFSIDTNGIETLESKVSFKISNS